MIIQTCKRRWKYQISQKSLMTIAYNTVLNKLDMILWNWYRLLIWSVTKEYFKRRDLYIEFNKVLGITFYFESIGTLFFYILWDFSIAGKRSSNYKKCWLFFIYTSRQPSKTEEDKGQKFLFYWQSV